MLGWLIIIYRQKADGAPDKEQEVAKWDTRLDGMNWLDRLSDIGLIQQTARNGGYPFKYEGPAEAILGPLRPDDHPGLDSQVLEEFGKSWGSRGHSVAHEEIIQECLKTNEPLSLEAWDLD